jgi:hypothetical protein
MIEDIFINKWEYEIYFKRMRDGQDRLVTVVGSKSTAKHIIDFLGIEYSVSAFYRLVKKIDIVDRK